jgi:colicin import membrane protein
MRGFNETSFWRQPGFIVSAVAHGAFFAASLYAFSSAKPFEPAEESVPVDVISDKQFNEIMKGEKTAKDKLPEPERRVDQIADTKKDNDPGQAKKDVAAEPPKVEPKPEPPQKVASVEQPAPPIRPPVLRPNIPTPPIKAEKEEDEKEAEIQRPKVDPLAKILEEKKQAEEAAKKLEAKRIEDKRLDDLKKAEADKAAKDKAAKEAKEKAAKEAADAKKLEDAIRNRLLTSKEAPSSSGATGAAPSQRASLGAPNATGRKLSPSERSQLVGLLQQQMNACLSVPAGAVPRNVPVIRLTLSREGMITTGPTLSNPSGEAGFMPFAEANMRALRNCQPYRIPARFLDTYDDWKNLAIAVDPSELR